MPEATFNNHRHATRTQRPPSTAVRPDAPRPLRSYFSSPSSSFRPLRRAACPDAIGIAQPVPMQSGSLFSRFPTLHRRSILFHRVILVALCEKRTYQTNPFVSPTSILVSRSTPHAFVKLGRAGKHGRALRLFGIALLKSSGTPSLPFFVPWSRSFLHAPSPVAFSQVGQGRRPAFTISYGHREHRPNSLPANRGRVG